MQSPWQEGDAGAASCPRCQRIVSTRFEYRSLQMSGTRLCVPDVLVAVCTQCDHTVSIPRQSMAQLLETSSGK